MLGSQVLTYSSEGTLRKVMPTGATYAKYRLLRRDPTVALARALLSASVVVGSWSTEVDDDADDDAVTLVRETLFPMREGIMQAAMMFGCVDFGWQGFEQVYDTDDAGEVQLVELKPLLPDITELLVDKQTGAFAGYRQKHRVTGVNQDLPLSQCLHVAFRVEGSNWFGEPLLENVRAVCEKWEAADTSAAAYDKKIAGSHFVVHYPPGRSKVDGADTDNAEVALSLLKALESSGSVAVPRVVTAFVGDLNAQTPDAWSVDVLQDSGGKQTSFVARERYLDALKVRALLLPERAVLEGQFGTRADAGAHADMAIVNSQLMDRSITQAVNTMVVRRLLALRFGRSAATSVRLVAQPLVDEQAAFLRQLYAGLLSNPQGFVEEFGTLDTDAIKDRLGVPKSKTVAPAGEEPLPGLTGEDLAKLSLRLAYDPSQPREPEGSEGGGRWADEGGADAWVNDAMDDKNWASVPKSLKQRLKARGPGKIVDPGENREYVKALAERGKFFPGKSKLMVGQPGECRFNALVMAEQNPKRYAVETGYAYLKSDKRWLAHAWVRDLKTGGIVETTMTRTQYFGIRPSKTEMPKFRALILHEKGLPSDWKPKKGYKLAFDPSQERDDWGKWSDTGKGGKLPLQNEDTAQAQKKAVSHLLKRKMTRDRATKIAGAMVAYTQDASTYNEAMRKGKMPTEARLAAAGFATGDPMKPGAVVYRGIRMEGDAKKTLGALLKPGTVIADGAFTSTSKSFTIAESFGSPYKEKGPSTVLKLRDTRGIGRGISAFSAAGAQNEKEVMYPPKTRIRVTKVGKKRTSWGDTVTLIEGDIL